MKRTRWIRLIAHPVGWSCLGAERKPYNPATEPWQRMVTLEGVEPDGRPVLIPLTPGEAREIGKRLVAQADRVDEMNIQHKNGWPL